MSANRDGVPVAPFAIIGFILGWVLVSAWRNPGKTVLIVLGIYLVSQLDACVASTQDAIHGNEVAATAPVKATTPAKQEYQNIASGCPDEAPNVGEAFPC